MQFCDLRCVHASAPRKEMDGSRSCMTFTAIWCDLFGRHVMKSQPCDEKVDRIRRRQGRGGQGMDKIERQNKARTRKEDSDP